ncbi:hypothetical protein GCM10009641_87810 [Mycobacterium cookii]
MINDASYVALDAHLLELMATVKPTGKPHTRRVPGAVVAWRRSGPRVVSVSRREAVARLDELIGPKA